MSRHIDFLIAMLAALVLVSCGDSASSTAGPAASGPGSGKGSLVLARPDGIVELDLETHTTREIVKAEGVADRFLLDPAVSRDGSQLAYIQQAPTVIVNGRYDSGTDLWVAARDGGGAKIVYKHSQPNALVRFPRWTPDGDIIAIIQEFEDTTTITRVAYTVQRINVKSGARTKLIDDAYAVAISPEGARMAYSRSLPGGGESFESVALDGGGDAKLIVTPEEHLQPFNSPQYSPDGTSIAFASADQRLAPSPTGRLVSIACAVDRTGVLDDRCSLPASVSLDGLPEDVWLVDAGGGRPRLLAEMKEDLPSLAWSGDGRRIYLLGSTGLYEIEVASAAVTRIGDGVFHGQIAWAP